MENVQSASREVDPLLAPGCCSIDPPSGVGSLPLHQLDNQPETPGPMSVLEWRRAVWFQVQSIHHTGNHQASYDIKKSDHRAHSWMLRGSSTNSDSSDESLHSTGSSRPLPLSPHHATSRKPTNAPLIDLSQPADADGRPIQFEDGRAKLVAQSNKSNKRTVAAPPDIEQRHREAIRRLQAEATEQLVYAEWEAAHQRSNSHFELPRLHRLPSKKAPLQKLSDFARRSVSNFSLRTAVELPPSGRTVTLGANPSEPYRVTHSKSSPATNYKTSTGFMRMIKKIGTVKRSSKNKKLFSLDSEASISRKSLLSSFHFSASNPAFHSCKD